MNRIRTAMMLSMLVVSGTAFAQEYAMSCEDVISKLNREATAAAKERFADLAGSCLGVVDRDGDLYMHTNVVVRRATGRSVTLYVPATDRTFVVETDSSARVVVAGRKMRIRDLNRGQELSIYVSVDEFTEPVIDEVAFETEAEEELVVARATIARALPTTG